MSTLAELSQTVSFGSDFGFLPILKSVALNLGRAGRNCRIALITKVSAKLDSTVLVDFFMRAYLASQRSL